MTRDDIIKMARWARLLPIDIGPTIETWQIRRKEESLVRFAALVAAAEREACAKLAEEPYEFTSEEAHSIASAIRARGEQ
jgi:hypothetical protein